MKKHIIPILIIFILLMPILIISGCTSYDPLTDDLYIKGTLYTWNGTAYNAVNTSLGGGDVVGINLSDDNAIARYDGATGKRIQNSSATISDFGVIYTPGDINSDSDINAGNDVNVGNDLDVIDDADIGGDLNVIGSISGLIGSPTGRTATFTIAASNSDATVKAQSDYVCDGTDDQVQIQSAIDSLGAYGGKIHLAAGQYNLSDTVDVDADHCWIDGEGYRPYGTMIYLVDNADCNMFDVTGDKCIFSWMEINGNSTNQGAGDWYGISFLTDASDGRVDNCYFWYIDAYAIRAQGNSVYFKASYTMTEHCGGGIWADAYRYHLVGCASFYDGTGFNFSGNLGNVNGIWMSNTDNGIVISGNYTLVSGVTSYYTTDTITITGDHNTVNGLDSYWSGQQLITMTGADYNTISNVNSYMARQTSIWIEASNYNKLSDFNMVDSCAAGTAYAVLYLRTSGTACTYNTFENIISVNPNETNKPKYGAYEANAAQDYNYYIDCRFDNIATYEWLLAGANSRRFDNKYATIGTVANHIEIGEDGTITLIGDGRVERGQWIDASGIKAPGVKPATETVVGNLDVDVWRFADQAVEGNQQQITFQMKIPADMDRTEAPKLAIGWSADVIVGAAVWQLEYLWTAPNESTWAAAQETLTTTSTVSGTQYGLIVAEITGIDLPSETDVCLHCRLTRKSADAADTMTDDADLIGVCLIYTADKLGG